MQDTIDTNRQYYDEKMKKIAEALTSMIISMINQIKFLIYSPDNQDLIKYQDPITGIPANKKGSTIWKVDILQKWWYVKSQT